MADATRRQRCDGVDVEFAPAAGAELARQWCGEFESWFGANRRGVPGAESKKRLSLVDTPIGTIVAKRERAKRMRATLAGIGARKTRSTLAFHLARRMRARGVATPEPLAVLTWREGLGVESLLVARYVEATEPWTYVASGLPETTPQESTQESRRDALITALADALVELHSAGFRHRDLKTPNILVRHPHRPDRRYESLQIPTIEWVDLDGAAEPMRVGRATRVRDLARLAASFDSPHAHAVGATLETFDELARRYVEKCGDEFQFDSTPERSADRLIASARRWADSHARGCVSRGRPLS